MKYYCIMYFCHFAQLLKNKSLKFARLLHAFLLKKDARLFQKMSPCEELLGEPKVFSFAKLGILSQQGGGGGGAGQNPNFFCKIGKNKICLCKWSEM